MENASKALLIGGAVLIAIVIIGIALATINSTKGMQESKEKEAEQIAEQIDMQVFSKYIGEQPKAVAISMVSEAIAMDAQFSIFLSHKNGTNDDYGLTQFNKQNTEGQGFHNLIYTLNLQPNKKVKIQYKFDSEGTTNLQIICLPD